MYIYTYTYMSTPCMNNIYIYINIFICIYRETLPGDRELFWIGSARTRWDADAAHMRKAPGVMQMRQTRQMLIDGDAWIRNLTDKNSTPETWTRKLCAASMWALRSNDTILRLCGALWPRKWCGKFSNL